MAVTTNHTPRPTVTVWANRSQSLRSMERGQREAVRVNPDYRCAAQWRMDAKPLLLTMGDACGIGPEILLKALTPETVADGIVVGEPRVLGRAASVLGLSLPLACIDAPEDLADVPPGALAVLRPPGLPDGLDELPWGRVDARCGAAAAACVETAAKLLMAGRASAMVTAPLHKEALAAAGIRHPGHTEMLQALAAAPGGSVPRCA